MSGHTKGPWATHRHFPTYVVPADHAERPCGGHADDDLDLENYAQEVVNTALFTRHRTKAEVLANAHLIAAAPDMREASREIDRLSLVILSAVNFADKAHLEAVSAALKANRDALAKATPLLTSRGE